MRVLIVEGDTDAAKVLAGRLERHGYASDVVKTGNAALRQYYRADLVLMDLELPDLDGLEVCREIRSFSELPIIVVTARSSELDRVLGLQAGSDDYLVKPYGFRELMARIDAVMRRVRGGLPEPKTLLCGALKIDTRTRRVWVGDREVGLTRKEFDFLHLLASRPETVFSRRLIMSKVWECDDSTGSRTIDTHVSGLRNKLGGSSWIVTVRGVGFRLGNG